MNISGLEASVHAPLARITWCVRIFDVRIVNARQVYAVDRRDAGFSSHECFAAIRTSVSYMTLYGTAWSNEHSVVSANTSISTSGMLGAIEPA